MIQEYKKYAIKIKREFPLGINCVPGAWSNVGTKVRVPGTYRNFVESVLFLYHVENVFKDREICKLGRVWLSFLSPTCSLEIQLWTRVVWCLVEWLVSIKLPFSLLKFVLGIYLILSNSDKVWLSSILSLVLVWFIVLK